MKLKINIFKDKIFLYAILFSLVWHIFWLSSINVVVVPKASKQVRFSGISFLGPIADRGTLKVGVAPRERTALEIKYLERVEELSSAVARAASGDDYIGAGVADTPFSVNEEEWAALTITAIDAQKIEPGREL